jgi:flagellar biosynthesis chaperone FliJ
MENNDLVEKVFNNYRNAWIEASSLNIVQKSQLEIANENIKKLEEQIQEQNNTITKLKNQIEAIRNVKPAQQAPKQEQK